MICEFWVTKTVFFLLETNFWKNSSNSSYCAYIREFEKKKSNSWVKFKFTLIYRPHFLFIFHASFLSSNIFFSISCVPRHLQLSSQLWFFVLAFAILVKQVSCDLWHVYQKRFPTGCFLLVSFINEFKSRLSFLNFCCIIWKSYPNSGVLILFRSIQFSILFNSV